MPDRKIGLALGGGSARGIAHVGVLEVLEKEGIPIDIVTGTSAGALIGCVYARRKNATYIRELAADMSWNEMLRLIDLDIFSKAGFIKGDKIIKMLLSFIDGDLQFSDLELPFACVATDIETGEEVVFDSGPVTKAVRASISIPGLFNPVFYQGRYLVDGILVNPVPISLARRMGADFVIAVDVSPDASEMLIKLKHERANPVKRPNIIHIIMQSIHISTYSLVKASLENADIVIEPEVAHIGAGDFHHNQELIRQGIAAAEAALPEIKNLLKTI